MTINELLRDPSLRVLNNGGNCDDEITSVYCCDLLSCVMSSAPAGCVWVTVMSNINTLAVAALTDCAAVVLAAGIQADSSMVAKANSQGITLLSSEQPVFETALHIEQQRQNKVSIHI